MIHHHTPGQLAIRDYSGLIGGALIALGIVLLSIGEPPDLRPSRERASVRSNANPLRRNLSLLFCASYSPDGSVPTFETSCLPRECMAWCNYVYDCCRHSYGSSLRSLRTYWRRSNDWLTPRGSKGVESLFKRGRSMCVERYHCDTTPSPGRGVACQTPAQA